MSKPASRAQAARRAVSSWAGATVQALNSSGTLVGTGTANAGGSYSVSVPPGSNYFIRAQVANLVLKAFVPTVSSTAAVNVNPASTAKVLVLANIVGVSNLGELSIDATAALSAVNVDTVMTQIASSAGAATLAGTLATNIASGYNAGSATPSVGSADTAVATTVTAAALAVTGGSGTTGSGSGTSGGTTSGGSGTTTTEQCNVITDPNLLPGVPAESPTKWTTPIDWAAPVQNATMTLIGGGAAMDIRYAVPAAEVRFALKGHGFCASSLTVTANVGPNTTAYRTASGDGIVIVVAASSGGPTINRVILSVTSGVVEVVTTNVPENGG